MKAARHRQPLSTGHGSSHEDFEWEELPSLIGLVGRLHAATESATNPVSNAPAWQVTMPAALDAATPTEPFHEAMHGLSVREVREPDVFRHFFGSTPTR